MSSILQISDHSKSRNGPLAKLSGDLEGVADLEHLENHVHPGHVLEPEHFKHPDHPVGPEDLEDAWLISCSFSSFFFHIALRTYG